MNPFDEKRLRPLRRREDQSSSWYQTWSWNQEAVYPFLCLLVAGPLHPAARFWHQPDYFKERHQYSRFILRDGHLIIRFLGRSKAKFNRRCRPSIRQLQLLSDSSVIIILIILILLWEIIHWYRRSPVIIRQLIIFITTQITAMRTMRKKVRFVIFVVSFN